MKIVIVEDSRLARSELRDMLASLPGCIVIGEAETLTQAKQLIDMESPDLVLLDIHLPDGTGFELLEQLDHIPQVIFTTAYDQHALAAFEVNALDFLLKPIETERFQKALKRAQDILATRPRARPSQVKRKTRGDQIFVRDGERCVFLPVDKVHLWEIDGNYTRLHFDDDKVLVPRSLSYLEERLDNNLFFRANRQQILNLDYIKRVEPWVTDGYLLHLTNGCQIEVSRRQAKVLRELLEL